MEKPPGVSRAACRFVLRLDRLSLFVGGDVVDLERFKHFGGVTDRKKQIAVVDLGVCGEMASDYRHVDAIAQPALKVAEGFSIEFVNLGFRDRPISNREVDNVGHG
jgi:hypothetical protein